MKILNGEFHNIESVGKPRTRWRTLSRGMHCRSWEYEDGGDELVIQKNGSPL